MKGIHTGGLSVINHAHTAGAIAHDTQILLQRKRYAELML